MHIFKRFYLLSSLIGSFIIPLITFTTYVEIEPIVSNIPIKALNTEIETITITPKSYNLSMLLWSLYSIGALLLCVRFYINLNAIISRIKKNTIQKDSVFSIVLVENRTIPHTFFNYIFFNKRDYLKNSIPSEVILHEKAHAKQKHSFDILFLEVLQIMFWFNPLIYFFKKAVKLNHEFLADEAVLKRSKNSTTYQNILLSFTEKTSEPKLAHGINYSSIKKRFTLMKTETPKQHIWIRSFLLLPLLALLLFSFSHKEQIQIYKEKTQIQSIIETIELTLDKNGIIYLDDKVISIDEIKAFKTPQNKSLLIGSNKNVSEEILGEVSINLVNLGFKDVTFYKLDQNNKTDLLPTINGIECDNCKIKLSSEAIENALIETNEGQKIKEFRIKFPGKPTETIRGNKLNQRAINYLKASENGTTIQIFNIKTKNENLNSNIFIKLVLNPTPPAPLSPPIPPVKNKINSKKYHNTSISTSIKELKKRNASTRNRPKSTLDHIIFMAKKGADFYYNGDKVTSNEAIKLVKKNPKLNMSSQTNNGVSTVHLSEKGITIINGKMQKPKTSKATTNKFNIATDSLEELKNFNWQDIESIFDHNHPEDTITLEFSCKEKITINDSTITDFNFKISDQTKNLESMIKKAKKVIQELKP